MGRHNRVWRGWGRRVTTSALRSLPRDRVGRPRTRALCPQRMQERARDAAGAVHSAEGLKGGRGKGQVGVRRQDRGLWGLLAGEEEKPALREGLGVLGHPRWGVGHQPPATISSLPDTCCLQILRAFCVHRGGIPPGTGEGQPQPREGASVNPMPPTYDPHSPSTRVLGKGSEKLSGLAIWEAGPFCSWSWH